MSVPFEIKIPEEQAILRLLSGPFSGCEYRLGGGNTLVVVSAESELLGGKIIPEFPHNAIIVPLTAGGVNFEIVIDEHQRDDFKVRILGPQIAEEIHAFQKICRVGELYFALRPANNDWAPGIVDAEPPVESGNRKTTSWGRIALAGMVAMFAVMAGGLSLWMTLKDNKRVAEVAAVIAGSSQQYQLVKGRDGAVYVLAESERDVSWAKQALTREGLTAKAKVTTWRDEEKRLNKLLLEKYPTVAFHRLKLVDSSKLTLIVSEERAGLNKPVRQELKASLHHWAPYAETITIAAWSDDLLDQKAKSGLDRLGIPYSRSSSANSVTYAIQGSLNDIDLSQLHAFTNEFYRDFGSRYVYFLIDLKDDLFKGKSFKYGGHGYVKMAPKHWFFPQSF